MIAWKYFDKNAATVAALRDYDSMRAILDATPDSVKAVYEKMTAPKSAAPTGMPFAHDPQAAIDRLTAQVDKLDILRERYRSATEYMAWFGPAWFELAEDERHTLQEFYMGASCRSGATKRLMAEYKASESNVERLRRKAIRRLELLLFG